MFAVHHTYRYRSSSAPSVTAMARLECDLRRPDARPGRASRNSADTEGPAVFERARRGRNPSIPKTVHGPYPLALACAVDEIYRLAAQDRASTPVARVHAVPATGRRMTDTQPYRRSPPLHGMSLSGISQHFVDYGLSTRKLGQRPTLYDVVHPCVIGHSSGLRRRSRPVRRTRRPGRGCSRCPGRPLSTSP